MLLQTTRTMEIVFSGSVLDSLWGFDRAGSSRADILRLQHASLQATPSYASKELPILYNPFTTFLLPSSSRWAFARPLRLPPSNITLPLIVMTPPITIIVLIAAPIHPAATHVAHLTAALRAAKAVPVVLAVCAGVGRAVAGAELADLVARVAEAFRAAFGAAVAVVVLFAGATGVGADEESRRWGCGSSGGEGDEGEEGARCGRGEAHGALMVEAE
jgi:hypothetical protein